MSQHLDLEEQEQLEELKHFWKQYGNWITWALILVLGSYVGWSVYQYWQRDQAAQSSALYDEVERAALGADTARLDRALADMKDKFGRTTYAQQAALLAAKTYIDKGNTEAAKAALRWVVESSPDAAYQSLARLRLAGVLTQNKELEEALKVLASEPAPGFAALFADRSGDIYLLQGKKAEARGQFEKAYKNMAETDDYRRLVGVKLNSLGVDAEALAPKPTPSGAASGASK